VISGSGLDTALPALNVTKCFGRHCRNRLCSFLAAFSVGLVHLVYVLFFLPLLLPDLEPRVFAYEENALFQFKPLIVIQYP
jgi:hypothetical protein